MKRILVGIFRGLLFAWYRLCRLFPRQRRILAVSRQSDEVPIDMRLIAQELERRNTGYSFVVLAKKYGVNPSFALHILKQAYYIATSEAVLLERYSPVVSFLAGHIDIPVIQMWHALGPMKEAGYQTFGKKEGKSVQTARLFQIHRGYTAVLISSRAFADKFAEVFDVSPDILYEAPLPRADLLRSEDYRAKMRKAILSELPQLSQKKNIVYAPTFRKDEEAAEAEALDALAKRIDFDTYNLIFKRHPLSEARFTDERVIQDYPATLDMLYIADYVVSDYSTVIYEAGLLDASVLLYTYDLQEYLVDRGLLIDIAAELPGIMVSDAQTLVDMIESGSSDQATFREFVQRYIALPKEGTCTARIVDFIFELIETGTWSDRDGR